MAELADALASGASDRKIIGVRLSFPAHTSRTTTHKRKIEFMADCVFCKIIKREIPAQIVWENDGFLSMLDVRPAQPGHLLIIPKEHIDNVFDMPDELYGKLFAIAKVLSKPLQKAMGSVRVGMVVEGFGVPHAHLHLIPINKAHDLDSTNARTMDEEELKGIAEKIIAEIKN
jgi:histidine triad (HIT) family protein